MRGWRYDYPNHIQTMKAHITLNQISELKEYLGKLDMDLTTKDNNHGFGIKRINAFVNKYDGYVNRQNEPKVFQLK